LAYTARDAALKASRVPSHPYYRPTAESPPNCPGRLRGTRSAQV